jgi:hypothetical protein
MINTVQACDYTQTAGQRGAERGEQNAIDALVFLSFVRLGRPGNAYAVPGIPNTKEGTLMKH